MSERCPTCGRLPFAIWTNEAIIEALQAWTAAHRKVPSSADWSKGSRHHPSYRTVTDRYGSWNAAIEAAGLVPVVSRHAKPEWTRDRIIREMRAWHREHGQPPTRKDWEASSRHPSNTLVRARFGSWRAAVIASGLEPRPFAFGPRLTRVA